MKTYTLFPVLIFYLSVLGSSCQKEAPKNSLAHAISGEYNGKAEGKALSNEQNLKLEVEAVSPNMVRIKGEQLPTLEILVDELVQGVITQRNRYSDLTFIYLRNKNELSLTMADNSFSFEGVKLP